MKPKYNPFLSRLALIGLSLSFGTPSMAASLEWKGSTTGLTGGIDQTWDTNTTANWWDGISTVNWPALGGTDDDAVFGGTAGTVTITTATANDITFNTTGYMLSGGTLTLNGTTPTITTGTGIDATISSIINGSSGLTKAGAGILTLSGANAYTGATTISVGTLKAGSSTAFSGTGALAMANAANTFDLGGFNASFTSLTTSGGANNAITTTGAGSGTDTLTVTAHTAGSGALFTDNGTRKLALTLGGAAGAIDPLTNTSNTFSGGLNLGSNMRIGAANNTVAAGGKFGKGTITIGTNAQLYFSGTSNITIDNPFVINNAAGNGSRAGSVRIQGGTGNILSGQINANSAAATFSSDGAGSLTLSGKLTGSNGFTFNQSSGTNAWTLILNNASANNDYAGTTTIGNAQTTLRLGAANQIPNGAGKGNVALTLGRLDLNGYSETINGLTGAGTIDNVAATGGASNTLTLGDNNATGTSFTGVIQNTAGSLSVTKIGTGTQTLAGVNGYSGTTSINGGTLQISAANALGNGSATNTISLNTGTLRSTANSYDLGVNRDITLAGAGTIQSDAGTLTVSGDVTNGANKLTLVGNGNIVLSGVIGTGATPTGGLDIGSGNTIDGNVTLGGNNLFTGGVTLVDVNTNAFNPNLILTHSGSLGVGPKTVTSAGGGQIHLQNNIAFASNIAFTTSGDALYNDSGSNTINGNITMTSGNGDTMLTSSGGLFTVTGTISNNTARTLQLLGNGDGLISGVIQNGTGTTTLVKNTGTGTWTLTGANSFTGTTTISEGTLRVGAASGAATSGTLFSSSSITNNAALIFRRTNTSALDLAKGISGTGSVAYEGTGVSLESQYTVNDASSYQGGTTISNARAAVTNATGFGTNTVVVNSGGQVFVNAVIDLANNFSIAGNGWLETSGQLGALRMATGSTVSGDVTLTANSRIAGAGTSTISGDIGGGFNLETGEDSATGTVIFSGNNSYTGTTTVSFGTLQASHASALGGTANGTSVTSGAALALAGGLTVAGESVTINGIGSGDFAGALKAGTGGGTWAGQVILGATTPRIGAIAGETLTVSGSIVNGSTNAVNISGLSGTGAVVLNPSTTNTYTGNTNVFRGILRLGKSDALPTGTTLDVDGATGITDAVSFDLAGFNQTVGGLQDTATTNVNGVITNSVGSTTSLLTVNQAGATDFGGIIQDGAGVVALTKSGAGTLTLSGANTYTGATNVSGGSLLINGNISTSTLTTVSGTGTLGGNGFVGNTQIQTGGTLSPGNSIDDLGINGDLALDSGSFSFFEIDTTGDLSDLAIVTGLLTFGGTLDVNNVGSSLVNGDIFNLFDWGTVSGTFTTVNLPTLDPGLTWDQSQLYTAGTLTVIPEPNVAALLGTLGTLILLRRRRTA